MVLVWIVKIVLVLALLGVASALSTPKGRLPLALRGLTRMMRKDRGETGADASERGERVSAQKRFFAFLLVIVAIIVAIL